MPITIKTSLGDAVCPPNFISSGTRVGIYWTACRYDLLSPIPTLKGLQATMMEKWSGVVIVYDTVRGVSEPIAPQEYLLPDVQPLLASAIAQVIHKLGNDPFCDNLIAFIYGRGNKSGEMTASEELDANIPRPKEYGSESGWELLVVIEVSEAARAPEKT